jgi:alkylation response protein AidB-like acyl-CoA dehydrogenase
MESPVGQAITIHGTDDQRARLLPSDLCCIGFSEPDHGSDLAAVETRGDVIGNDVIVTGAKIWLAHADQACSALVLCRTEPTAPRYHNLSCVLVPLHDNNVELRPLRQISGDAEYCEAFFEGARAPLSNIVGGRGNGWRVAMTTLAGARSAPSTFDHAEIEREYWDLVETARQYGRDRDPLIRQQLAWAYGQARILQLHHLRAAARPRPDASLTNLLWSDYRRRLGEIAIEIIGADALVRPDGEAYATSHWQRVLLSGPAESVAAGTSEIQRTMIGERVLGLPK